MLGNPAKAIEKIAHEIYKDLPAGVLDEHIRENAAYRYNNGAFTNTVLVAAIRQPILDLSMTERIELIGRRTDEKIHWSEVYETLTERLQSAVLAEHAKVAAKHDKPPHKTRAERRVHSKE